MLRSYSNNPIPSRRISLLQIRGWTGKCLYHQVSITSELLKLIQKMGPMRARPVDPTATGAPGKFGMVVSNKNRYSMANVFDCRRLQDMITYRAAMGRFFANNKGYVQFTMKLNELLSKIVTREKGMPAPKHFPLGQVSISGEQPSVLM